MYAVFPFQRFGVGLPDMRTALATWRHGWLRREHQDRVFCWYQNGIFTARLGLTAEAAAYNVAKLNYRPVTGERMFPHFEATAFETRYPAFFNPYGFCHPPCLDGGGAGMIGLQEMLLQTPGNQILLLPAWPADWDVDFKLHAPRRTVVEARVRNGVITRLKVTPRSRSADVQVCAPFRTE
jgi:hypothetical protein